MSVNYKMVGRQIKVRRRTRRMNEAFLAEQVELSVSYISCMLNVWLGLGIWGTTPGCGAISEGRSARFTRPCGACWPGR